MMVTFISQCEKKALNRTRRVLDAFADRIGDNTWQTVITQEGLLAVKKLLRKTASKNTAVSCFWIRSRSRSELVWVVGNRGKFNEQGVVPVNSTKKNRMNSQFENDWHHLPAIKALTAIASLLHDWGKATALFQKKLNSSSRLGDPLRHEWISCLLLNALVQSHQPESDQGWLSCLLSGDLDEVGLQNLVAQQVKTPLHQLPPVAKLVAWLIVSHHRLPAPATNTQTLRADWQGVDSPDIDTLLKRIEQHWGYENRQDEQEYLSRRDQCFQFPNGLLSESSRWMKEVKKWAQRLLNCQQGIEAALNNDNYRLILHHSRLCLMLGDHFYSSQNADMGWQNTTGLYANTDRETKEFKQKLDEHLVGVAKSALLTTHLLPAFESAPPVATDIQSLKKPSPPAFRWQDKAVKEIVAWRAGSKETQQGFFAVNMAGTGCGKTFANAKIMQALSSDGKSLRYILALGLRTLTLQTGDEYRERIGLADDELAVLIGSKAVSELHHQAKIDQQASTVESTGSESQAPLLDEFIDYDCDIPEAGLATVLKEQKDRQFLYAPVLACTIDHIISATETKRGGRYILPCLRLMSSDLVIDEIDDFTGADLVAIGRLIHMAGMLGRKVMISSATIPPDLAEGYFNAYQKGWQLHAQSRDAINSIACLWVDQFKTELFEIPSADSEKAILNYREYHGTFIAKTVATLSKQPAKRKVKIVECHSPMVVLDDEVETKQEAYFALMQQAAIEQHHQHYTVDAVTGVAVSFGVIRVANIGPCVNLTQYLLQAEYPSNISVKVMAYHSQQVLLLRHEQEKHLDFVLKRKEKSGEQPQAFSDPVIRTHLESCSIKNMLFILVATPVEEVGRDHDFDWSVIEPSSYRSIIQLAGRVRRHREQPVAQPNTALMQYNWKAFEDGDKPGEKYFRRPGYEDDAMLKTHDLENLVDTKALALKLDATARIQKNKILKCRSSLADLEHYVIQSALANYLQRGPEALQGYLEGTWHLTALPQQLNPFRRSEPSINLFLMLDEEGKSGVFAEKDERGYLYRDDFGSPVDFSGMRQIGHKKLSVSTIDNLWLVRDYPALVVKYAEEFELSERRVSQRYGEISFVWREGDEYEYNDQLGLVKKMQ